MTRPVRLVVIFVLRLWREPGDREGDAGWRGLVRTLGAEEAEAYFQGLDNLPVALRRLLAREDALTSQSAPTDPEPEGRDVTRSATPVDESAG